MFECLNDVDWDMLNRQKCALLEMRRNDKTRKDHLNALSGVIHLLDSLQDDAIADGLWDETCSVNFDIAAQTINDLIITALEGGISHWAKWKCIDGKENEVKIPEDFVKERVIIEIFDGSDRHELKCGRISNPKSDLCRGLMILANDHPDHFHCIYTNGFDAEDADAFIQCCIFGKIKYE